ncbi:MAG: PPC domain-containing DNA-binding protein [Deltaproteobacteria bacterium]
MLVAESHAKRTLIVRLERKDRLHARILEVCRERGVRCARVTGLGAFEEADLVEYDQAKKLYKPAQTIRCAMELLSLQGNVSERDGELFAHLHVAVSREREDQARRIELLGGHLNRAVVFAAELTLDCYDDVRLHRLPDAPTGLALWGRCEPA